MYPRHAAFIEGAEEFAASFFNISAPEASEPESDHTVQCYMLQMHFVQGAGNGPATKVGSLPAISALLCIILLSKRLVPGARGVT